MVKKNDSIKAELLVLLIQTVKVDPFETLMKLCDPIIYGMTKKYFLDGYDKSDLIQEARSILVEATNEYNFEESMDFLQFYHMLLSNHLNKLVRREHTDKRKVNKNTTSLDELVEEAGLHVQGLSPIMSQPEDATLANGIFDDFLAELSPFEKDVFLLFLNGKNQKEIAGKLQYKIPQVRSAIYRCSTKLKRTLNN